MRDCDDSDRCTIGIDTSGVRLHRRGYRTEAGDAPLRETLAAGVLALTKTMGKELAKHNFAVNAVTPAVAKTTIALSQAPDFLKMIISKIPCRRILKLSEVASMICWLATKENSFTTGAVFDLSGGQATY